GEDRALSALVGQTRAAALRVLTDPSTNSELAARLGVSPGVASRHAAVLRETGLITTRRLGSSVLHTVTPLGTALLGGQPLDVLPFTAVRDARVPHRLNPSFRGPGRRPGVTTSHGGSDRSTVRRRAALCKLLANPTARFTQRGSPQHDAATARFATARFATEHGPPQPRSRANDSTKEISHP
ncbi:helix-turn-helix transcriptional regulator, partial [Streptomyces sp. WAC08241]|uniref:ArsR/SmtB family transcription factor n=1 Tax=Streptomyces sp. WAC08241 TaxID=2487421 RepID=UPI000F90547F